MTEMVDSQSDLQFNMSSKYRGWGSHSFHIPELLCFGTGKGYIVSKKNQHINQASEL